MSTLDKVKKITLDNAKDLATIENATKAVQQVRETTNATQKSNNTTQKSFLSADEMKNLKEISKNPKTLAGFAELLHNPAVEEAFLYSKSFRSTILANAKDGLTPEEIQDIQGLAAKNSVKEEITEVKEALKKQPNSGELTEAEKEYYRLKKESKDVGNNPAKMLMAELSLIKAGITSGSRACTLESIYSLASMGASMNMGGKLGGWLKLTNAIFGSERIENFITGGKSKIGDQIDSKDNAYAQTTVQGGMEALKMLGKDYC